MPTNLTKFQKIPNVFDLDIKGRNAKYSGQFSTKEIELCLSNKIRYMEKLDGTNIRVYWDGYNITFHGRTENSDIPEQLLAKLEEHFLPRETIFEKLFGERKVILFGEGIGEKIQNSPAPNEFVLFDVKIEGYYISNLEFLEQVAKELELRTPEIKEGTLDEVIQLAKELKGTKSKIVQNKFEGFIIHPLVCLFGPRGSRISAKLKCEYL